MHLKFLLGFLSLLTAATAVAEGGYVVPTDAAPGFYTVEFHEDGNTTTQKIDLDAAPLVPGPPEKRSPPSAKFARQLQKRISWGGSGRWMAEHNEYNSLTVAWRNYLNGGGGFLQNRITYFITDHLVLAVCHYGRAFRPVPLLEAFKPLTFSLVWDVVWLPGQAVDDFNYVMDQNVGYWQTGWVHMGGWHGDFSFWRDYRGHRICDNLGGGTVP